MPVSFISCEGWSEYEWNQYRLKNGIGASEGGTVMNLNPYMSSLELHHLKTGQIKPRPKNLRMCIGHLSEFLISDLFEYWVRDEAKFLNNVVNKKKVRELEVCNSYCTNSEYPSMFASLDRRFKENGEWVIAELKNKTTQSYMQYENQFNPMELVQIAFQLLVTSYSKAYLVQFINNSQLEVFEMSYEEALALKPSITKAVKTFWSNVEKARICLNKIENAKQNYNMKLVADLEMELLSYEPESSGNAYLEYLTQIAKDKKSEIGLKATDEHIVLVNKLAVLSKKRKKIEDEEVGIKSKILHDLRMADKNELDLGRLGKVGIWNNRFKISLK